MAIQTQLYHNLSTLVPTVNLNFPWYHLDSPERASDQPSSAPGQLISELSSDKVHTPVPISYDGVGIRWPAVYATGAVDGGRFCKERVWVRQVSPNVPHIVILLNRD